MTDLELQSKVTDEVLLHVDHRIWSNIWNSMGANIRIRMTDQIDNQIYEEVRDQVVEQMGWGIRSLMRDRFGL